MALSNTQAKEIIRLRKSLHEYDQQPTTFAPRHCTTLVKGSLKLQREEVPILYQGWAVGELLYG